MISFSVDSRYTQDLEDDFVMNEDLTLYEFLEKDPVKAFYLGLNIKKWSDYLDKKQKYLYSKQVRHNSDDIQVYQDQIEFWANRFNSSDSEQINMVELAEYILNNLFYNRKTETQDKVKLAFFFGNTVAKNEEKCQKEES
jgi:hypothetical protein